MHMHKHRLLQSITFAVASLCSGTVLEYESPRNMDNPCGKPNDTVKESVWGEFSVSLSFCGAVLCLNP